MEVLKLQRMDTEQENPYSPDLRGDARLPSAVDSTQTKPGEFPTMPDAVQLYDEADALKEQGKLEEAIAKLKEALAVDETYTLAHSALGILLQK